MSWWNDVDEGLATVPYAVVGAVAANTYQAPRSRAETARLFEQVALVMGKIGLINGAGGTARPRLPRAPAHSTFSARVGQLGPIEAASTI